MTDDDFLARLRTLCLTFDQEYGDYPEHEYEGAALYQFASTGNADYQIREYWNAWAAALKVLRERKS